MRQVGLTGEFLRNILMQFEWVQTALPVCTHSILLNKKNLLDRRRSDNGTIMQEAVELKLAK
jgi:hypothetical protein